MEFTCFFAGSSRKLTDKIFIRIAQSETVSLHPDCKCRACIILMSVRKIAKDFQGYLHLIAAMRKHILPYSKRCIIHSSVNNFKGMGTDRRLIILCDSHNLFIDYVNLRRFCCKLSEYLYFSDFSLKRFCFPFQPFQIRIRLAYEVFCPCFRVGGFLFRSAFTTNPRNRIPLLRRSVT